MKSPDKPGVVPRPTGQKSLCLCAFFLPDFWRFLGPGPRSTPVNGGRDRNTKGLVGPVNGGRDRDTKGLVGLMPNAQSPCTNACLQQRLRQVMESPFGKYTRNAEGDALTLELIESIEKGKAPNAIAMRRSTGWRNGVIWDAVDGGGEDADGGGGDGFCTLYARRSDVACHLRSITVLSCKRSAALVLIKQGKGRHISLAVWCLSVP